MGTGKSSAAINYMNDNKDTKFIYITPYLDEAARIKEGCPDLRFVEPSAKIREYGFRKYQHTMALIKEGRNISTTHQSFVRYTQDTLDDIKEQGYCLIVDESVSTLESAEFHIADLQLALDAGYVAEEGDEYVLINDEYNGSALREMFNLLKSRRLIRLRSEYGEKLFYWTLPSELLTSFRDVYILTYLFEGQSLYYFMQMYNLSYERIGIRRGGDGSYHFCEDPDYVPDYVANLPDMIDILDNDRMNAVGDSRFALSASWYDRDERNPEVIRKNMTNYFNNICKDVPADRKLWGTFKGVKHSIQGKGYTNAFLNFNTRATNAHRDKNCLAYPINIYMNVGEKMFYKLHGLEVDEEAYALSIMIQWIWRSEIRTGEKIRLYIPSRRMRELLIGWMYETSGRSKPEEGDESA